MSTATRKKVLISGASIAGPALALWLVRYGFDVTIVEKANALRPGGQDVDFKGATHRRVLDQMGILAAVQQARSVSRGDGQIVNAAGRPIATMPAAFSEGELEIARGELARILFEHTANQCTYIFGDTITALQETATGIAVTFQRAAPRVFDLVVGADGIHSNVRKLVFGPEKAYVRYLGYYYALAKLNADVSHEDLMYNEPGRMAAVGAPKAPAFFVFASETLVYERDNLDQQKKLLRTAYQGGAWQIPLPKDT